METQESEQQVLSTPATQAPIAASVSQVTSGQVPVASGSPQAIETGLATWANNLIPLLQAARYANVVLIAVLSSLAVLFAPTPSHS